MLGLQYRLHGCVISKDSDQCQSSEGISWARWLLSKICAQLACVAGPLHMLTHSNVLFVWTDTCQKAINQLKSLLTTPSVLAYPNFNKPFQLHTDAIGQGLGAVVEQQFDGLSHPVAFTSRTLSKHEQRYGITELESLAVVWSFRHFRVGTGKSFTARILAGSGIMPSADTT